MNPRLDSPWRMAAPASERELSSALARIDGRGYRAYREIEGAWELRPGLRLSLDRAQADPFASPSRVRVQQDLAAAGWPTEWTATPLRQVALGDFLARRFRQGCREASGEKVRLRCHAGGAEVLARSTVALDERCVEVRFRADLPGAGRRVQGRRAQRLLLETIGDIAHRALTAGCLDHAEVLRHLHVVEDQSALREQLEERGLVAFLAEGSVLPRESGVSRRPLAHAVPLQSPESMAVTLQTPHRGPVTGMGIPKGATVLCGGAFHGKSTLLDAIAGGVYDHVPGDGREYCVTLPHAAKLRAEQGRSVSSVDIAPLLGPLPGGADPACFRSENASGSTSQAASLMEALEAGAGVLLLDEDTSASNLLSQDAGMRRLLAAGDEPIRHLVWRVRELVEDRGVSIVIVMGGSSGYFPVADRVVQMRGFQPLEVTSRARSISAGDGRDLPSMPPWQNSPPRFLEPGSIDPRRGRRAEAIRVHEVGEMGVGQVRLDLRGLEQLVDADQTRTIGQLLLWLSRGEYDASLSWPQLLQQALRRLDRDGFAGLAGYPSGEMARPRGLELAGAVGRLRGVRFRTGGGMSRAEAAPEAGSP